MLHLSETIDEVWSVAKRRTEHPVLFRIMAQEAHRAGIAFYHEGKVYLAPSIPPRFLSLEPLPVPP
jgi:RNA:NAD 2'-phosphotransferase (TPT1/KptA family)